MKSQRLYYDNAYLTEFEARRLDQTTIDGRPALALSQSAFYPTSGGQPHDRGTLNEIPVLDVQSDGQGMVWHVLAASITADTITGKIDWGRRFDHMQNHSGQHILTRAFIEVTGVETLSFHLGDESVTIDLERADLSPAEIDAAEDLANQVIAENRIVRTWFPEAEEWATLSLRKISEKVQGAVRVVDIGGFDVTACGGTHVARTGEIGMIKILKLERKNETLRVEFCCGGRALRDYREKNALLNSLAAQMTTGYTQIPEVLNKWRDENKTLSRELKEARQQLLTYEGEALYQKTLTEAPSTPLVITHIFTDRPSNDLQQMASQLVLHPQTVALLGLAGEKAHLVFARSEDLTADMASLLKSALARLGNARGGGRPMFAQGGGVSATAEEVANALYITRKVILGET